MSHRNVRSPHRPLPLLASALGLTLLCGTMTPSAATELYRWTEADGSITFSPDRPPDGIDYERVNIGEGTATLTPTESDVSIGAAASVPDASEREAGPRVQGTANEAATAAGAGATPNGGLSYAPPPLGAAADAGSGISAGDPAGAALAAEEGATVADLPQASAAATRQARCRELEKRVVSLERRLSTRLTAEDMDNTVLYMARYQQSVDRHCRG